MKKHRNGYGRNLSYLLIVAGALLTTYATVSFLNQPFMYSYTLRYESGDATYYFLKENVLVSGLGTALIFAGLRAWRNGRSS